MGIFGWPTAEVLKHWNKIESDLCFCKVVDPVRATAMHISQCCGAMHGMITDRAKQMERDVRHCDGTLLALFRAAHVQHIKQRLLCRPYTIPAKDLLALLARQYTILAHIQLRTH